MVFTDALMKVADAQAFTTSEVSDSSFDTNPGVIPNAPDITQVYGDWGNGKPVYMMVTIDTAGTPGAGTCAFEIITSAAAALTSPVVIGTTIQIPDEDLLVATQNLNVPPIVVVASPDVGNKQGAWLRFLGCNFNVGTTLPAGWAFTVNFCETYHGNERFHASGFEA